MFHGQKVFYSAKYYKALALNIEVDSTFLANHNNLSLKTSSLVNTDRLLAQEKKEDKDKRYQYLLLSILGVAALVAIGSIR